MPARVSAHLFGSPDSRLAHWHSVFGEIGLVSSLAGRHSECNASVYGEAVVESGAPRFGGVLRGVARHGRNRLGGSARAVAGESRAERPLTLSVFRATGGSR